VSLPWDDLADAHQARADAEREGRGGEAESEAVRLHEQRCAALFELLLLMATRHGSLKFSRLVGRAFAAESQAAWKKAQAALRSAAWAADEVTRLRDRVAELERRLAERPDEDEPEVIPFPVRRA
jgi:hypothetical protein